MPNESAPHSYLTVDSEEIGSAKSARDIVKNIEAQLRASGKHPFNRELLLMMKGLESAKQEERVKKGISENFCYRNVNRDLSIRYKIGFISTYSNTVRYEQIVVSASDKDQHIIYRYSFSGLKSGRQIVFEANNNSIAIQRANRMLKMPIL